MDLLMYALFLSFSVGAYCIIHCSIFLPVTAGASGQSRSKGLYTILNIMLGRFVGYTAVGVIAGAAAPHVSQKILHAMDPYVYIVLGILFFLYGIERIPSFLNLCTKTIHAGPFLLGLASGIHPCPAFITLLYESIKFSGFFTAVGAFIVFFLGTSLFLLPLLILPALSRETYRVYMRKIGLMTAVLLGIFLYCSGIAALFQEPAVQAVPDGVAAFVPVADTAADTMFRVKGNALRNGIVFIGFLCAAGISYRLRLPYVRYIIGILSIGVIGLWLKIIPGSTAFADMWTGGIRRGAVFFLIPLSMIASAVIAGRIYCGYMCPAGIIAELAGKIGPGIKTSKKVHMILAQCKYILFAGLVTLIAAGFSEAAQLEPFSLFASFVPLRTGAVLYAIAFFAGAICCGRIWCMYLCPVGAFLGLVSRNCLFPKADICQGCRILRSKDTMEGECTRCLQG